MQSFRKRHLRKHNDHNHTPAPEAGWDDNKGESMWGYANQIIVNGNMASDVYSTPFPLLGTIGFSIHLIWSGSPTGTFTIEASNDVLDDSQAQAVQNWSVVGN